MNPDGYPEARELRKIKAWPLKTLDDFKELAEYVRARWSYPERWIQKGQTIRLSTGGWSGNESLVSALLRNVLFSSMCWQMSKRGGYHEFKLPKERKKKP